MLNQDLLVEVKLMSKILPILSTKNKFGDYHRSHKIKVKYVS